MFTGRTDVEAETPILWPLDVKTWLIWKDPDAGKGWGQEKGTTEDEMIGLHHWLKGPEFEQASGNSEGREASSAAVHGVTELDMTWQLKSSNCLPPQSDLQGIGEKSLKFLVNKMFLNSLFYLKTILKVIHQSSDPVIYYTTRVIYSLNCLGCFFPLWCMLQ